MSGDFRLQQSAGVNAARSVAGLSGALRGHQPALSRRYQWGRRMSRDPHPNLGISQWASLSPKFTRNDSFLRRCGYHRSSHTAQFSGHKAGIAQWCKKKNAPRVIMFVSKGFMSTGRTLEKTPLSNLVTGKMSKDGAAITVWSYFLGKPIG